ncbi:2,3-bisphosphoglycerate-independent phosphoglycerate mutase [Mangrovivirga cuniculi]|uniref:2,3-bisphosphoglycerate-independent phosphoglycerate mutase n=1 Tax=Mangrovivirga cuniculi TaxID=2715131 RepID=A0A4D7JAF1_9BACT|nr:2,3-bisphosphoglycerate-independent phosphoglycerate mutase [Mangrovivirga cuniculi]QCK13429.1 2,3-bisphosphoglycerate-independent phosphoglycerate mutase [Mangrovivirga cuniculi]
MRKVILMILDGWGLGTNPEVSAIAKANTPFMDSAFEKYPHSKLDASGMAVGLPEGQMGNSEVGHMNIGAGRVVYQDLVKINKSIEEGEIKENDVLNEAYDYAKKNNKKVHLIGLVSDGGVHSHINHLKGLVSYADEYGLKDVFVHAFTDGRDTDPKSGQEFIKELQDHLSNTSGELASIIGRYYAMDRDKRWERVKLAYDAMVKGEGKISKDPLAALKESYDEGVTDEFIKPIIASDDGSKAKAVIEEGDVVICFNFRTDRGREITMALTQQDFPEQNMHKLDLHYVTMTRYDDTFEGVRVIFEKDNLRKTLGETLADQGKKQIRIAETEKYPHVTFFFSGGREKEFDGEKRILIPSPKVATYDMQPEMSAREITDAIVEEIKNEETDFICLNFANPDMVGHTGDFDAAVKACETVDQCAKEVAEAGLDHGYDSIIIADHGNSDYMINEDGSPNTAHTTNLVPSIHVSKSPVKMKDGKLGDLAPTILTLMDLNIPEEMTGDVLLKEPVSQ